MSTTYTYDTSTEGTYGTTSNYTAQSDTITIATDASGGYIYVYNALTDVIAPTVVMEFRLRRSVSYGGTGNFELLNSTSITPTGGLSWHAGILPVPILVYGGDEIYISHTSQVSYRIYTIATCATHSNAVVKFDVIKSVVSGGLYGRYYTNTVLTGTPNAERIDTMINFGWSVDPLPGDLSGTYSVGWNGFITPSYSEQYTLTTIANGGTRLFINDTLIIDAWTDTGTDTTTNATMYLGQNVRYSIRLEFVNTTGTGTIQLKWSSASQSIEVIQNTALSITDPIVGAGLLGNYINQDYVRWRFDNPLNFVMLTPTGTRTDSPLDFNWTNLGPGITGVGTDSFGAKWTGYVEPTLSGNYVFYLNAAEGVRLYINDVLIIDSWMYTNIPPAAVERTSSSVALTASTRYSVLIHYFYYVHGDAEIHFSWESGDAPVVKAIVPAVNLFTTSSGSTNGLIGSYYHTAKGANFGTGDVTDITAQELTDSGAMVQRLDTTINFNWSGVPPGPTGIGSIYYTVEWNGWIRPFYTETYTFKTITDDGVRLYIDDTLLVNKWIFQGAITYSGQIRLVAGRFYRVKYQYFQGAGDSIVQFYWSSTLQPEQIVPTLALFADHPITGYGVRASYWNNSTFTGTAVATRIENMIDMSGTSLPVSVTAPDFSARWTGYVRPDFGESYTIYATSEGAVNVRFDDIVTISNETVHILTTDSASITLLSGRYYAIRVDYWTNGIVTPRLYLEWESHQQVREKIPIGSLFADIAPETINPASPFLIDGSGVYAEYYTSPAPTGTPVYTSLTDGSGTGFTFSSGSWPPGQTSFFSNVWTGYIMSYITGSHVFTLVTTGFGRVFIDADTDESITTPSIVLEFTNSGSSAPIPLVAYKQQRIRVEHMCLDAIPALYLQWEGSFQTLQVLPSKALYNASGTFGDGTNPPTGVGNGLTGRYFDNISFTGDPIVSRLDASGVAYNFGESSPADGIPASTYSVRWEGNIDPPATATYTFYLVGNYGTRLYINDMSNAIIDSIATPGLNTGTIALTAGIYLEIRGELVAYNGGNRYAFMSWSRTGTPWAIVPSVRLFAGVGDGLLGQYYNAPAANGTVDLTRVDTDFSITWPTGPGGGIVQKLFSVVWTGWIRPRYSETYTFKLYNSTVFTRVFINEDTNTTPVVDFGPTDTGTYSGTRDLSANVLYTIRLEMIAPYPLVFDFTWTSTSESEQTVPMVCLFSVHPETGQSRGDTPGIPTGNGNGLVGQYYNNTSWSGTPDLIRIDRNIQFDWSSGSPDPIINPDNFTVTWSGYILPQYSETYSFYTISDDGVIVDVSGINIINSPSTGNLHVGTIDLSANVYYPLQVQFKELSSLAYMFFMWTSANRQMSIVPRSRIFSAVGTGVNGQYWTQPAPNGPAVLERTDATINFDWTGIAPGVGVPETFYGIVWSGFIRPIFEETYTIDISGTGWSRVWLNNSKILEFTKIDSTTIDLSANDFYSLRVEHSNTGVGSIIQLKWSSATQVYQVIPTEAMFIDMSGVNTASNVIHGTSAIVSYEHPRGYGDGLIGNYFDTSEPILAEHMIVQRPDSQIAFDWSTEPLPGDLSGATTFSVSWEGFLTIPQTGNYVFYVISDGAIDMSLNLVSVINRNDYGLSPSFYDASGNLLTPLSFTTGDILSVVLHYSHETGTVPPFVYLAWGIDTGESFVMLPPDMLFTRVGDGVRSRYFASRGPSLSGIADATRIDETVTLGTLPVDISAGKFYAVWTGWIRSNTTENYTFYITAEGLARLRVDDILCSDFDASGTCIVPLFDGNYHNLRVEMLSLATPASIQLEWESTYHTRTIIPNVCYFTQHPYTGETGIENGPRETLGNGLIANYWSSATPAVGTPYDISGVDVGIAFDWNSTHPGIDISGGSDISGADFSTVWTGFLLAQFTEIHRFYVITSGRARLLIDDVEIFDVSGGSIPEDMIFYGTAGLVENNYHKIRVEFANGPGGVLPVFLRLLWWTPQNQQFATIPTSVLFTIKPRTLPGHAAGRNIRLDPSGDWVTIGEGRRTQLVEDARIACGISTVRLNVVQCLPGPSFPATGLTESVKLSQRIAACPPFRTSIAVASALNIEAISTAIARARNKDITGGKSNPDSETTAARIRCAAFDVSGNIRYIISSGTSESQTLERRIQVASTCAEAVQLTSSARFPEFFAPVPPNPLVILSTQRGVIQSQPGGLAIETCLPNTYQ